MDDPTTRIVGSLTASLQHGRVALAGEFVHGTKAARLLVEHALDGGPLVDTPQQFIDRAACPLLRGPCSTTWVAFPQQFIERAPRWLQMIVS